MNTVENVNPDTLLRRYFANREKFQQELRKYRKAVSDLHFNEILINSLKRSLAVYPNGSDTAWRIIQEIQTLKEKRIDLNSIVKTRKQNMQMARIRTNKYADLHEEVISMNRMGRGITIIDTLTSGDKIRVVCHRILETGDVKKFQFEK